MTIRGGSGPRDGGESEGGRPPMARRVEPGERAAGGYREPQRRAGTVSGLDMTRQRPRGPGGGPLRGLLVLGLGAIVMLVVVAFAFTTVLRPITRSLVTGWAGSNPGALEIPFVADLVREELGDAMTSPAGADASEVEFTVSTGETASAIAGRLVEAGLLRDARAFLLIALDRGVADQLDTGSFLLRRTMTPDQLVATLLEAKDPSILLGFRTGLRLEQMAAYLQARPAEIATLRMDPAAFLSLVRKPPASLLADYPWLDLPKGATLEGYLAAGEYRVLPDTTPEELVRKMLDRFAEELGPERLAAARKHEGGLHAAVTLASIVERETRLEAEKPLVAGVYQNRIDNGTLLNADPTVIWGVDLLALRELDLARWPEYSFWNVPSDPLASIEFPKAIAGYQTYQVAGLIPGPICTPTVSSIEAALDPATGKGYLYFVAIPNGDGAHDFSKTYEEHLRKLRKYGYVK